MKKIQERIIKHIGPLVSSQDEGGTSSCYVRNRSSNVRQLHVNRSSSARCVPRSGLHRISFVRASENSSGTVVLGALVGKHFFPLGASSRRRPGRAHPPPSQPAPPHHARPAPAIRLAAVRRPAPPRPVPPMVRRSGFWNRQVLFEWYMSKIMEDGCLLWFRI